MPDQEQPVHSSILDDTAEIARNLKRIEQEKQLEMQAKQLPEESKLMQRWHELAMLERQQRLLELDQQLRLQEAAQKALREAQQLRHSSAGT